VTDGGFGRPNRDAYVDQRRREVTRALAIARIGDTQLLPCLGGRDQEAVQELVSLTAKLAAILRDDCSDLILTHAFEGGHPDHDATAFIVRAAVDRLRWAGHATPTVAEMTSYWWRDGPLVPYEFLPAEGQRVVTRRLSDEERDRKAKMFACFETQQGVLADFLPIKVERFRIAPAYDFGKRPRDGQPDYRKASSMTLDAWCRLASAALDELADRSSGRSRG
jgi:LmbE family N-acetylglucosaminyl deacetylase